MGGELEAAGAMATAGLAAGAIEGSEATKAGAGECLNCGAQTSGRYCSNCGQATHPHRSLWHVVEELLHNLFHFDTKAWRTLPMVAFRPGTLTRNFVYGKRARYISPLATFLLSVFFMFFVFSLIPLPAQMQLDPSAREEAAADLAEARADLAQAERELAEERRDAEGDTEPGSQVGLQIAEQALGRARAEVGRREAALQRAEAAEARRRAEREAAQSTETATATTTDTATTTPTQTTATTAPPQTPQAPQPPAAEAPNPYPEGSLDYSLFEMSRAETFSVNGQTQGPYVERIRAKLSNPPLLRYQLTEVTYKFSFLLVPISLPFIAFLFLFKRGITLYDHVVYALYALSFASILFVLIVTAGRVPWLQWVPGIAIGIGLPIHTYFHLKGAYALGWWSALWRTVFMLTFALISLIIFMIIILFVGFLG